MHYLILTAHRIRDHLRNHSVILLLYLLGLFASILFFLYYFGNFAVADRFANLYGEQLRTYSVSFPEGIAPDAGRLAALGAENVLVVYHDAQVDPERTNVLILEEEEIIVTDSQTGEETVMQPGSQYTVQARSDDTYPYGAKFGSVEFPDPLEDNCIVLGEISLSARPNMDVLRTEPNPVVCLDGVSYRVLGVHDYGYESCIPYALFAANRLTVDRLEIIVPALLTQAEGDTFAAQLQEMFPQAQVQSPYATYSQYLAGEEQQRADALRMASVLLAIAFFVFMFLVKYLFDLSRGEDVVYRLVGASRETVTLLCPLEVLALTLLAAVAASVFHAALFDVLFDKINVYAGLEYRLRDYVFVAALSLLVSAVVCIPFLIGIWRNSILVEKNKYQ